MKKIKEEKLNRLRERFYHLANLMNLREETVNGVDERSMIWNFINASIHQFLRERDDEIIFMIDYERTLLPVENVYEAGFDKVQELLKKNKIL